MVIKEVREAEVVVEEVQAEEKSQEFQLIHPNCYHLMK